MSFPSCPNEETSGGEKVFNSYNVVSGLLESRVLCGFYRSLYHGNEDFGFGEYDRDEADEIITINRAFESSDRETDRSNNRRVEEEIDVEEQVQGEPKHSRSTNSYYDVSIVIGIAISAVFFVIVGTG